MEGVFRELVGAEAALVDLDARGRLRASGEDRVRFLDGMVTSAVADLAVGQSRRALLLDRKGRILSELEVCCGADALWIESAEGTGPAVLEALERHLVADDVVLEDLAGSHGELAVEGPGAEAALGSAGAGAGATGDLLRLAGGAVWPEGVRLLGPREDLAALRARLELPELEAGVREALRLEAFRPAYGVDVNERTFPAEGPYRDAVSFTKGCYVGQEIVARIDSRGGVHRLLVKLGSAEPVRAGAVIRVNGAETGRVTSAADSPLRGPLALGWVRLEHAREGAEVEIDGTPGAIVALPDTPAELSTRR